MKEHRYTVCIEYSNLAGEHPVYIQVQRHGDVIAEVSGKSLKRCLQVAQGAIMKTEEEEA